MPSAINLKSQNPKHRRPYELSLIMSDPNSQSSEMSGKPTPEITHKSSSVPPEPSQPSSSTIISKTLPYSSHFRSQVLTNISGTQSPTQSSDQEQSSSSSSSTSPPPTQKRCNNCSALQSELKPLKPCSKCQTVFYCDRECQKKHFKVHKKVCAAAAQEYAMSANLKVESSRRAPKDSHRGGLQKWQFDT